MTGHEASLLMPSAPARPGDRHSLQELAAIRTWSERRDVQWVALATHDAEGPAGPTAYPPDWGASPCVEVQSCRLAASIRGVPLRGPSLSPAVADLASRGWVDVAALVPWR